MKNRKRILLSAALFGLLTVSSGKQVLAGETKTKLFTLHIKDGYSTTKLPIYEYRDEASVRIAPEQGQEAVLTNAASAKVKTKVKGKSAYCKQTYKTVTVTKAAKVRAGKGKNLKIKAYPNEGGTYQTKIRVKRPALPTLSATLSKTTYYLKQGALRGDVQVKAAVPVTAKVQVLNKKGKTIYTHELGRSTEEDPSFVWYWDGRGSDEDYVAKGKYKATFILTYLYGKKQKNVKTTIALTVKNGTAAADPAETPTAEQTEKTWPWIMYITGNNTLDYAAEQVCQSVLTSDMGEVQRAKTLFDWCAKHFTRNGKNSKTAAKGLPEKLDVSSAAAKSRIKAYGAVLDQLKNSGMAQINTATNIGFNANNTIVAITKESGDCVNMARMYQVLCRHAGLDSDIIGNTLPSGDPLKHFWNIVKVNGAYYECDARMANARGEGFVHCLRGTTFMETLNPSKGNGDDDVRRYGNIDRSKAIYKLISKTDCPGR